MNFTKYFSTIKITLVFAVVTMVAACTSRPSVPPRASMPPTPPEFLQLQKLPSDRALSCSQLVQRLRYTLVMIESVDRVFESQGATLRQESSYSSTSGVAVRGGGVTSVYSRTHTIGGEQVYVYSDLAFRAKQITDAQQARRKELKYLMKANACDNELKSTGAEDYPQYIREAESDLRSARRDHERWIGAVRESQDRLARADTPEMKRAIAEDVRERIRLRDEFKNSGDAAQVRLDKLLAESKEAYARAESSAVEMRKWFEVNTKLP